MARAKPPCFRGQVRIPPAAAAVLTALAIVPMGAWPGAPEQESLAAPPTHESAPRGAALRYGKSVGAPNEGRLVGGAHLEETPYLEIVPSYAQGDVRWGLEPLVEMLDRAARAVRRQFPDAVTAVGHISRAGGGDIGRHHSHESGRDVDVAFFMRNHANKPFLADHFIPFKADGTAQHAPGVTFDDVRNWTLIHALLTNPGAHVTHVFVASPLRARLLAVAARMGASEAVRQRAQEVMVQPHGALPHDDHFHVRIGCPSNMRECIENPTLHLASHGRHHSAGAPLHPRASTVHSATARHETPKRSPRGAATPSPDPYEPLEIEIGVDDPDGT